MATTSSRAVMASGRRAVMGLNEVAAKFGCDRHTVMKWVRAGKFPAPFCPGVRKLYWRVADVERYLLTRGAATENR
jgi:predicted DNA-binding transcriptional regulator AlpA